MAVRQSTEHLIGKQFGRLTVVSFLEKGRKRTYWLCRCECGTERRIEQSHLVSGATKSCGCLKRDLFITTNRRTTHGLSNTPEWRAWAGMRDRCFNPTGKYYRLYGARGITVCDRWNNSFEAFLEDMGPRPSAQHSIDRINNDGNYEPGNCRWALQIQQQRNRRGNRRITFGGQSLTVTEWAERVGISAEVLYGRLHKGWSVERTLTEPVGAA